MTISQSHTQLPKAEDLLIENAVIIAVCWPLTVVNPIPSCWSFPKRPTWHYGRVFTLLQIHPLACLFVLRPSFLYEEEVSPFSL